MISIFDQPPKHIRGKIGSRTTCPHIEACFGSGWYFFIFLSYVKAINYYSYNINTKYVLDIPMISEFK